MKIFLLVLLFTLSAFCCAETTDKEKCTISTKNLNFTIPKSSDIVNTFWQDDKDGIETIKRLTVNYKDGSIAVIEHKFCSMYNFEVAYYTKSMSKLASPEAIKSTMTDLFAYASVQDKSQQDAITAMTQRLTEKDFTPDSSIATGYDGSNDKNQSTEYSISYLPIEESSIHKAALFIYMGIGVEH